MVPPLVVVAQLIWFRKEKRRSVPLVNARSYTHRPTEYRRRDPAVDDEFDGAQQSVTCARRKKASSRRSAWVRSARAASVATSSSLGALQALAHGGRYDARHRALHPPRLVLRFGEQEGLQRLTLRRAAHSTIGERIVEFMAG